MHFIYLLLAGVLTFFNSLWLVVCVEPMFLYRMLWLDCIPYRYCFEVLKCDTITGISVLRSSPDVECSSGTYGSLRILGACGFVFYTIGYIAFTSYTLIRLHYTRMYPNKSSILRFGYLYERFELGYAWVAIASKLLKIHSFVFIIFIEEQLGT